MQTTADKMFATIPSHNCLFSTMYQKTPPPQETVQYFRGEGAFKPCYLCFEK